MREGTVINYAGTRSANWVFPRQSWDPRVAKQIQKGSLISQIHTQGQ